jgi:hypothetical protein
MGGHKALTEPKSTWTGGESLVAARCGNRVSSVLGTALLLAVVLVASLIFRSRTAAAETPVPAPTLDVQITSTRDTVVQETPLAMFIIVGNASDQSVTNLNVALATADAKNPDFTGTIMPPLPASLAGHTSVQTTAVITPTVAAAFGQDRVLFTVSYDWAAGGQKGHAIQGVAVPVQVNRRFEDEAKGFLGGNGAFFYLLLPIVPLFLGYQLVDGLRTQRVIALPAFKSDFIVPAFLFAVILNLFLVLGFAQLRIDYSDPRIALDTLGVSFVVGVAAASLVWGGTDFHFYLNRGRWTFQEGDPAAEYLRKVLLRPGAPKAFEWVTGNVGGTTWQGVRLTQPTGGLALGATLQVSRNGDAAPDLEVLRNTVVDDAGNIKSPKQLVELVRLGLLSTEYLRRVRQANNNLDGMVRVNGLAGFQEAHAVGAMLVRLVP